MGLLMFVILCKFWWLILLIIFGIIFTYCAILVSWSRRFDKAVAQQIEEERANKKPTFSELLEEFIAEQEKEK